MKPTVLTLFVTLAVLTSAPVRAQQITGTPGSPSATITIDGAQLPPPLQRFEGKIERNAAQSTPYWPPALCPPRARPTFF